MITVDKNMEAQTSLRGLSVSVLVLDARNNSLMEVLRFAPSIIEALGDLEPGTYRWLHL